LSESPDSTAIEATPVNGEVRALDPVPEHSTALTLRTPAAQAAVVALTSFVAGAATLALVHRRRNRRALGRPGGRRRALGRKRGEVISVAGTRSFLVDVHLLNR
jgi:hypothetical protein